MVIKNLKTCCFLYFKTLNDSKKKMCFLIQLMIYCVKTDLMTKEMQFIFFPFSELSVFGEEGGLINFGTIATIGILGTLILLVCIVVVLFFNQKRWKENSVLLVFQSVYLSIYQSVFPILFIITYVILKENDFLNVIINRLFFFFLALFI